MKKLIFIQLALGLFQIGQAVRNEVELHPEMEKGMDVCGGRVRLERLHNRGTAGGKMEGHMPAIAGTSGLITAGCAACFLRLLWKEDRDLQKTGFAFLVGGALSNLYERCKKGYVVDYLRFRLPSGKLGRLVFNLADLFIFAGALMISIGQKERV